MGLVRKINSPVAYLYSTEENPLMPFLKNKHFLIQVSSLATLFVLGEMLAFINTGNFLNWHLWFNFFRDRMIADFFANMPVPTVTVSTVTVEPVTWERLRDPS